MSGKPFVQHSYGISTDIFVARKSLDDTLVLGGVGVEYGRWTRVLTQRAAQQLWFNLTGLMFPEKAQRVTGIAVTAPLRSQARPTITSHLEVTRTADNFIEVIGWAGQDTWWFRLSEQEARVLWTKLDLALYPVGWEGRERKPQAS